jgi:GT2 family glycosyltransferase
MPNHTKVIVIDDATPEPALGAWLDMLASIRHIHLIRHLHNLGFPAAANSGILAAGKRDILLLNSDTLVPPGAIEAIIDAAYARPDIGTATPFSNEATILSYPRPVGRNAMPDLAGAAALQALAAKASDGQTVEIPTCIGSCVLLRHDCVAATDQIFSHRATVKKMISHCVPDIWAIVTLRQPPLSSPIREACLSDPRGEH